MDLIGQTSLIGGRTVRLAEAVFGSRRLDQLLFRQRLGVQEGLHRRLAKAPSALMRPLLIIGVDPAIQVKLQRLDAA